MIDIQVKCSSGNSFMTDEELSRIGFKSLGKNVQISRFARFYSAEKICIGNNVRIDDFCVISGAVKIGNYVHLAVMTSFFAGNAEIEVRDFSTLSSRCAIYAISDDYSGKAMTSPVVHAEHRAVTENKVIIGKHVIIGTGCTILPGVVVAEGTSVGAMSLINKSTEPWGLYYGVPCKRVSDRKKDLLQYEQYYIKELNCGE